jgi:hypothetical protein
MHADALIVCTTDFGRTSEREAGGGRNHHNRAHSSWMAGGIVHGQTDEYGRHVVEGPVTTDDFHATILHLLGIDHERLTYRHAGRDFRLTDVHGTVIR